MPMAKELAVIAGVSCGAVVLGPEQQALADRAIDIFDPPSDQVSFLPHEPHGMPYGHYVHLARWHVAQWNDPDGDVPDLADGHTENGSMSFGVSKKPSLSYVIMQDGRKLACSRPERVNEFDGLVGTNTSRNNPELPSAEVVTGRPVVLSQLSSLTQTISLRVRSALLVDRTPPCRMSKAVSLVCITLTNLHQRSTLFYQILLYAYGTEPKPDWWARGNRNGRYGYNDPVSALGPEMAAPGTSTKYRIDVLPRMRALIENSQAGMDNNLGDWYISGAYFGNAIWGGVRVSTEWAGYSLRGTVQQGH